MYILWLATLAIAIEKRKRKAYSSTPIGTSLIRFHVLNFKFSAILVVPQDGPKRDPHLVANGYTFQSKN